MPGGLPGGGMGGFGIDRYITMAEVTCLAYLFANFNQPAFTLQAGQLFFLLRLWLMRYNRLFLQLSAFPCCAPFRLWWVQVVASSSRIIKESLIPSKKLTLKVPMK